ncbi:MAG: FAD-dependent oxidoreductase, partial [Candidatus Kerfeldbacteria bacterium]|nr:FAD-dependent oxidoreductase [Candidatus Kerfeldbacteria bacterium]
LNGKGVVYCATCDAPLFRGKRVAVVGGGNSAMDAALLLRKLDADVWLLNKNPEFHGEKILMDHVAADSGINVLYNVQTTAVLGTDRVTGLTYADAAGATTTLDVDGVFVEIGFTVNSALVKDIIETDRRNQVIISDSNGTSVPGLFAAGDVTTIGNKQVVISAGEGAKAALAASQYLQARGLIKKGVPTDWGVQPPSHFKSI